MMKLYHGSPTGGIQVLEPRLADHGKPYLYLTTLREVAAVYLTCSGERPCYWYPYGYTRDGRATYTEAWPDALAEAARGRSGWIYTVEAAEEDLELLSSNPKARLSTRPLPVAEAEYVPDAYDWLLAAEAESRLEVRRYEQLSDKARAWWRNAAAEVIREQLPTPDSSCARLMRAKFPDLWAELAGEG